MKRLAAVLGVILATALALELSLRGFMRLGWIRAPEPAAVGRGFWDGNDPRFGVWHRPGASVVHESPCFRVTYRSNSLGARDREREPRGRGPRVLVLGDSFLEGWGLERRERLSDLLEAVTGLEHVNLAMSHFGPYQASLVYEELGARLEHDRVLVGVVPHNDFGDLDYEQARRTRAYRYRYRPYLVGSYPDYERVDHREGALRRLLRRHSSAYHALDQALHALRGDPAEGPGTLPKRHASGLYRSGYFEFGEPQFERLRYSLERIAELAAGRQVVVLLIPVHPDFMRWRQSGEGPLVSRLEALGQQVGFRVVDLLPLMAAATYRPRSFFFTCDYHWNALANEVTERALAAELAGDFYPAQRAEP